MRDSCRAGETALLKASREVNVPLVRLLLSRGADVHRADNGGHTPIWAARGDDAAHVAMSNMLREHGAGDPVPPQVGVRWA